MPHKPDAHEIILCIDHLRIDHSFKGPMHYTDFTNLGTILDAGMLYSRGYCDEQKINFLDSADHAVLEHTNIDVQQCVRFYYKEKTPAFYTNEGIKYGNENPHIPIPIYLIFDYSLMYDDNTIFSDGNGASKYTNFGYNAEFLRNMDWPWIFHRDKLPYYQKQEIIRKRHAELLSVEPVSTKFLSKIVFRCEADKKRAINLFGNNKQYRVDPTMFNNHNNYVRDYSTDITRHGKKQNLSLHLLTNQPVINHDLTKFKIMDMDGNLINEYAITFPEGNGDYYVVEIDDAPRCPFKINFSLYGILSIEKTIE